MCERTYICLCGGFVCVCAAVYTHTSMCFCLNGPLWFSVAICRLYLCSRVRTHPSSLSTVVDISNFRVCVFASDWRAEEEDLLCEPCVTTDTDERGSSSGERQEFGFICQSLSVSARCLTCDWQSVRCYLPLNSRRGWKWALMPQINVFLICVSPPGYL